MLEQRMLFSESREFVVKHNFNVVQPKWNARYTRWFGDRNQGRIVSAASEKEAVEIMAKKFRLNPFYLIAAPATEKDKKEAKAVDEALLERAAPLGSGERFKALTRKLKAKGAKDAAALAAWIGRKKYGKKKMAKLSAKGRRSEGVFTDDFREHLTSLVEVWTTGSFTVLLRWPENFGEYGKSKTTDAEMDKYVNKLLGKKVADVSAKGLELEIGAVIPGRTRKGVPVLQAHIYYRSDPRATLPDGWSRNLVNSLKRVPQVISVK